MLAKRVIPCLDVMDGKVVKGIRFKNHTIMGEICDLALRYRDTGADELVFYDITASSDNRSVCLNWIEKIAKILDIPFCVAGGIRTLTSARNILNAGADKISINSPALERPQLISELANTFGQQCIVIGIDSCFENNDYFVYQYTGRVEKAQITKRRTLDWALEVENLGAGEIVLNCMNQDGMRQGYDIKQLQTIKKLISIPIIASGGAGSMTHFQQVFEDSHVDGALAASVFHTEKIAIPALKSFLSKHNVEVRI